MNGETLQEFMVAMEQLTPGAIVTLSVRYI
jgi:hypothetical protein